MEYRILYVDNDSFGRGHNLQKKSIAPFFPVAAILLSLFIATPVQAEFRYSYAMMTTIPLFIMIACSEEKRQDEENSSIDTMLQ